jgi:hypothetical protein
MIGPPAVERHRPAPADGRQEQPQLPRRRAPPKALPPPAGPNVSAPKILTKTRAGAPTA